jgi:predicted nuclease with TOPRIM domain
MVVFPTQVAQRQVDESKVRNDNLPLLQYNNIKTLEDDLNYLRSVLKQLKGTINYDSPVLATLEDIRQQLEDAIFENAQLTGTPTATTPPTADVSTRIATTEYVNSKIDEKIVNLGADSRFVYLDHVLIESDVWVVNHNLGKYPSVTVVTTIDGVDVEIHAAVHHHSQNQLEILFGVPTKGKAYLN